MKSVFAGILPVRKNTAMAAVLMRLLCGKRLTPLDALTEASTTRLAAVVCTLEKKYGWHIDRTKKAVGCQDGRLTFVFEYWLDSDAIACAMKSGAASWTSQVRAARAVRRAHAPRVYKLADRVNDFLRQRQRVRQSVRPGLAEGSHG